jgi:hypothetical protein
MPRTRFCGICGGDHDPNMPCFDTAGQVLKAAGIPRKRRLPRKFNKIIRATSLIFLLVSLMVIVYGIFLMIEK